MEKPSTNGLDVAGPATLAPTHDSHEHHEAIEPNSAEAQHQDDIPHGDSHSDHETHPGEKKRKRRRPTKQVRKKWQAQKRQPADLTEEVKELILVYAARASSQHSQTRRLLVIIPTMQPRTTFLLAMRGQVLPSVYRATKAGGVYLQNLKLRASYFATSLTTFYAQKQWNKKWRLGRILYLASKHGRVDSLDWWVNEWHRQDPTSHPLPFYDVRVLVAASRFGHVDVLEWWRTSSGLPLEITALDKNLEYHASANNRVWVGDAVDWASRNGHIDVLEWWYRNSRASVPAEHRVPFCCTSRAMDWATLKGKADVLQWWLKRSKPAPVVTTGQEHHDRDSQVPFADGAGNDSGSAIDDTIIESRLETVVVLKYSKLAMAYASRDNHIDLLDWWVDSGIQPLRYCVTSMKWASEKGHVQVLDWWWAKAKDPACVQIQQLKVSPYLVHRAGSHHPQTRQWWEAALKSKDKKLLPYLGGVKVYARSKMSYWRKLKRFRQRQWDIQERFLRTFRYTRRRLRPGINLVD